MNKLNSENVARIFNNCLFNDGEEVTNYISCEGISCAIALKSQKLQEHAEEIYGMLRELPKEFMKETGGGYSFLMACNDKDGNQWTGLHIIMEQLFLLGIGIGKVECLMPRELWGVLPGGMPYYVVN